MKKYLVIVAAVVLAMTACKKGGNDPKVDDNTVTWKGVTYKTVTFNTGKDNEKQTWMAENLRVVPDSVTVSYTPGDGAGVWYPYKSDGTNATAVKSDSLIAANGYLYDYNTVFGLQLTEDNYTNLEKAQGICPDGWHIPSRAELVAFCGAANKFTTESAAPTDSLAIAWCSDPKDSTGKYQYGSVEKVNSIGWNFPFSGSIGNKKYQTLLVKSTTTDVEEYVGKLAVNYFACSTGSKVSSGDIVMCALMSTFTKTNYNTKTSAWGGYGLGRLSVADCSTGKGAVSVRCVKNN